MKCKHCKQDFVGPIPLGLHHWSRKGNGRCSTPEEMIASGWYCYHGQWFTSKPAWVEEEEARDAERNEG